MAKNSDPSGQQQGRIALALAGLLLATAGVSLSEALLNLSMKSHDKFSIFLPVHAYVFFLVPLTFHINMLLLLQHVLLQHVTHAGATEAPLSVILNKHLPQAAPIVSLANLLLSAPLLVHISVAEQSVGFAIGAVLAVLAMAFIFTSAFKKILISCSHAGRGFMPAFFSVCISTGTLISSDPISSFSNSNHHAPLIAFIPIHLFLSFFSFFAFILGITLLFICGCAPADGPHVTIHAKNLIISPLCVAIATIVIGWYMKMYMTVTGMGYVPMEAARVL